MDRRVWSWSDGSSWSYEKFVSEGNKIHEDSMRLYQRWDEHWVGTDVNHKDNYLCQYIL